MPLNEQRSVLLGKIETVYGTDSIPTGAANAILISDLNVTPLEQDTESRNLIRPFMGSSQAIPVANRSMVEFSVEVAGAGAAGTVPAYGILLRACGMAQVITAGNRVEYSPVSSAFESATFYCVYDGVQHRLTGARGTFSVELDAKKIPRFKFKFTGLFNPVTDVAMPTAVFTAWQQPLAVLTGQTSAFSLHGFTTGVLQTLSIDLANTITHRMLVGFEGVSLTDRQPTGKVVMEAELVAVRDWWTTARNATSGALSIQHGNTAGNIVVLDAPAVQLSKPSYSSADKIRMLNLDLVLNPSAGNDELRITVR